MNKYFVLYSLNEEHYEIFDTIEEARAYINELIVRYPIVNYILVSGVIVYDK